MKTTANIAGVRPAITGTLYLNNGTTIALTGSDFVSGSFSLKSGSSNGSEFTVGAAIIGACSFAFVNDSGKFSGLDWFDSRVRITLTFGSTVINTGYFYTVSHKETGHRVQVETYTAMKLLDEYQIYEDSLTFPSTASAVVSAIAAARGLTVSGMRYPNMVIPDPGDDQMTERELISYIAQCMGQFVVVDDSVLRFKWYDLTNIYDVGNTFSHDLRTSDISITGVKVTTGDGNNTTTQGSSGYVLNITDNPLITADNLSTVASQIYSAVNGITFRPGSVTIKSNAAIEAGDALRINTGSETVTILATTITYKPTLRESITADAEPYAGDLRINKGAYYKKLAQTAAAQTISSQLNNPNSELSKAISEGGGGGGGGGNVGGQNNRYGQLRQYNDSSLNQEGILLDKDGMTVHKEGIVTVEGRHSEYARQSAQGVTEVVPVLLVKQGTHYFLVNYGGVTTQMLTAGHVAEDAGGHPKTADMDSSVKLGQNLPVVAHAMVDIDALYPEDGSSYQDNMRIFRVKHGQDTAFDVVVKPQHTDGLIGGNMSVKVMEDALTATRDHAESTADYGGMTETVIDDTVQASVLGGLFEKNYRKRYVEVDGDVTVDEEETSYTMGAPLDEIIMKDANGNEHYIRVNTSGQLVVT